MAQQRLVVGSTPNRQQAEAAAEALRRLGLSPRVLERTSDEGAPFAVAYYARTGQEAARLEQVFETLKIDGEVMYEELPDDHRLVRVYNTSQRPESANFLANLMERAGLHVVRGENELFVPRSQEPDALNVIRHFEETLPKHRRSLMGMFSESSQPDENDGDEASESVTSSGNADVTQWETAALRPDDSPATDEVATYGPAIGQLPEAWPCCPGCGRPRETHCPMCQETGYHFPPAEVVPQEYINRRQAPAELAQAPWPVLCPVCDWLFEPIFYRRCPWCGHDFGEGREIAIKPRATIEPLNTRVVVGLILTIAVVVGVLVYLVVVAKARDPRIRPARAVPFGIGLVAPAACDASTPSYRPRIQCSGAGQEPRLF